MSIPKRVPSYRVPMSAPVRRHAETTLGYAVASEAERKRERAERVKARVAIGLCVLAFVYVGAHVILAVLGGRL